MTRKRVYLDQNKWIVLARAVKHPDEKNEDRAALEFLIAERQADRILLPLTATNVYERHTKSTILSGASIRYIA